MLKKILCCLLLPTLSWAGSLPVESAVPGGIVQIPVADIQQAAPQVYFHDKPVLVVAHNQQWLAVVGIPLDEPIGEDSILVKTGEQTQPINFFV